MFEQLTTSVRRLAGSDRSSAIPLVRVGESPQETVVVAQTDISALRGVTGAAADTSDCVCPEPCERDHANE